MMKVQWFKVCSKTD